MRTPFAYGLLMAVCVLIVGCSPIAAPTPTPAPAPTATEVAVAAIELPQEVELSESAYLMNLPAGWTARALGPTTMLEEHTGACDLHDGYCVVHDYRDGDFVTAMGLPENATLEDLMDLNRRFFNWNELADVVEGEVFGVPALGVRYADDGVWGYIWTGFLNEHAFMINVAAPSEAELDGFLPTFEAMLASARPVAE